MKWNKMIFATSRRKRLDSKMNVAFQLVSIVTAYCKQTERNSEAEGEVIPFKPNSPSHLQKSHRRPDRQSSNLFGSQQAASGRRS